jgi:transcriptional regulator with XRE-family HTH domain
VGRAALRSTELCYALTMVNGNAAAAVGEVIDGLGAKVREVRQQKGLSLQRLAERAGVSAAAIYRIEQGNMIPTITTLMKLAVALNRPVSYFVNEFVADKPVVLIQSSARHPVATSKQGLDLQGITGPYGQFLLAGAVAVVEPGADSGSDPMVHPGEELVHLLDGRLEFTIDDEVYALTPGDSLHFRTDRPHLWRNPDARKSAQAVWMAFRTR